MKNTVRLFLSLLFVLIIHVSSAMAQGIQPSGKMIGSDKQGNAIYQVQANGIKIGYKLIGSGEPLVMIPGLSAIMDRWPQELIEALSKKYQLIMLDNRGMGYTTANDATFSAKLFAEDVISLLDTLGVKQANILGHSMGSMITQELLLVYPQRFNKAILSATATDGGPVVQGMIGKVPDEPIIRRQMKAAGVWKTPMDKLPKITNQVMFIVGTSDTVVGIDSSKKLASAIPGAWLVQIKEGTHSLMFEAPTEYARIVFTFLDMNETVKVK
jgi:pimeloyl-ACP methyl ester carboxylesterase